MLVRTAVKVFYVVVVVAPSGWLVHMYQIPAPDGAESKHAYAFFVSDIFWNLLTAKGWPSLFHPDRALL
jgi:hypothetical protein